MPHVVTILNHKLPEMKDSEEIDMFVAMFEAALRENNIPEDQWIAKLHSHLSPKAKLKIQTTIQDADATYEEIKEALLGCSNITFSAAAETLMTGNKGKTYLLNPRQCHNKLTRPSEKVIKNAHTIHECAEKMATAFMRQQLAPTLKTYVDMKGQFQTDEFLQILRNGTPHSQRLINIVSENRVQV